jgi:hypothetical protein
VYYNPNWFISTRPLHYFWSLSHIGHCQFKVTLLAPLQWTQQTLSSFRFPSLSLIGAVPATPPWPKLPLSQELMGYSHKLPSSLLRTFVSFPLPQESLPPPYTFLSCSDASPLRLLQVTFLDYPIDPAIFPCHIC